VFAFLVGISCFGALSGKFSITSSKAMTHRRQCLSLLPRI
jgi:hypothetical protein